jgi:hypothetical protein
MLLYYEKPLDKIYIRGSMHAIYEPMECNTTHLIHTAICCSSRLFYKENS